MIITLVNLVGVIILIVAAKIMSRDNKVDFFVPVAADVPGETLNRGDTKKIVSSARE